MAIKVQIQDIANTNVDYSEKALVPPFEFALIKDLHRDNRGVLDGAIHRTFVRKMQ
jgi:hypothetical protein